MQFKINLTLNIVYIKGEVKYQFIYTEMLHTLPMMYKTRTRYTTFYILYIQIKTTLNHYNLFWTFSYIEFYCISAAHVCILWRIKTSFFCFCCSQSLFDFFFVLFSFFFQFLVCIYNWMHNI